MNTFNMRQAFANQHGQCLIIDIADVSVPLLKNLTKAVQNVLTLACSVRGGVRIPAFSLTALTKGNSQIYEFDVIRGNYIKIVNALNSLSSYCQLNERILPQEYTDSLYLAIDSVLRTYNAKQGNCKWIDNVPEIEITFVTVKNCNLVRSYIETFIQDMEVTKICKITIIELQIEHNQQNNSEPGFIQTLIMNANTHIELEKYFKYWLLDKCSDIDVILKFPDPDNSGILPIKCDIFECLINPLSLPFGHRVYMQMDCLSVQMTGMSLAKSTTSNVPIYGLNILSRISSASICESSVFGLPLCLRPSQSWRLTVDDEQMNRELFSELCRQLNDADQLLFAQLRSMFQTDFSPYFLLAPGDCCLLMKSYASSDIILPWKQSINNKPGSVENSTKIFSSLQNLELVDKIDPNNIESGLLQALTANLKHATQRGSDLELDDESSTSKRNKRFK